MPVLNPLIPNAIALRFASILVALGCVVSQIWAILFPFSRGEVPDLALDDLSMVLAALVLRGFLTELWEAAR